MPISATMSVWGLYQIRPTLFDGLSVPTGVDIENVKDNILLESASLEVLYSNPDFLEAAIGVWSTERLPIWEKLYATTQYEYNPIENYDRHEEGTNSASGTSSGSTTASESGESSGTSSGQNESISSNTAYDSNTFADSSKGTSSGTNSTTNEESRETSNSGNNEYENSGSFTTHVHGNIGVTTTQQMIEQERKISDFCITSIIVEEFINKFCIGVY